MSLQLSSMEQMFFIERDPGKSVIFSLMVSLCEEPDPARLKEAAERAAVFFPRLQEKPVLTKEGKLVLRPNDQPIRIFENTGKPLLLGSAETGGYLFAIRAVGREISVSFSHAVADAGVANAYLRQLMYEYFRLSGEEIPDEGLVYTEKTPAEHLMSMGDAIAACEERDPSLAGRIAETPEAASRICPAVEIYSDWPLFGTPYAYVADLTWDNGELMRAVKALNATPFSFLSAVIAHAACRVADTDGKVIRESYGYSMRNILQVQSQCIFTVPAEISYETEASLPETLKKIRSLMDAAGTPEKLLRDGKTYDMYADMLVNGLDMHDIVSATEKLRDRWKNTPSETFYLANPGIMRFPSRVQERISEFSVIPGPQKKVTDLYSFAYRGKGALRTVINSEEEHLLQPIAEIMADYGIRCTYREIGKTVLDRTDVMQFEREGID